MPTWQGYILYTVILKAVILNTAHPVRINLVLVYCSTFIKLIWIKNDINEEFQIIKLLLGCLHELCLCAPCHYFDYKYCNILFYSHFIFIFLATATQNVWFKYSRLVCCCCLYLLLQMQNSPWFLFIRVPEMQLNCTVYLPV